MALSLTQTDKFARQYYILAMIMSIMYTVCVWANVPCISHVVGLASSSELHLYSCTKIGSSFYEVSEQSGLTETNGLVVFCYL